MAYFTFASTDALVDSDTGHDKSETDMEQESITKPTNENISLLWALQRNSAVQDWDEDSSQIREVSTDCILRHQRTPREVIIPLVKDSAFFELLSTAIHSLSNRPSSLSADFTETLEMVSRKISDSARPVSVHKIKFKPHSAPLHPVPFVFHQRLHNARYINSKAFESLYEAHAGEQSIQESEKRLKLFVEQVSSRGSAINGNSSSSRATKHFNPF
ncbi:hypothetical protein BDP27DRAFT_1510928 [Rhodocollybia butyracea]|uniref:Uncharacterized protein n=1 Tax=Rhodocollybia butyracea TaxID=206335 RepID=A0A9P5P7G6_9AGAR|nr:hypothetical protein BDP27DRAFT_1510928 [Rhodocollybia butyracea]